MVTTAENPLLEGLELRRKPESCVLVIFGASGDLTQRKLMPALYALAVRRLLPDRFAVLGAARSEEGDEQFRERMKEAVQHYARDEYDEEVWEGLASAMYYSTLDFSDQAGENQLADRLTEIDRRHSTNGNRLYYFAVPPSAIATLVEEIAKRRSADGWVRLIIEKPFGREMV